MINNLDDLVLYTYQYFEQLGAKKHFEDVLISKANFKEIDLYEVDNRLSFLPKSYLNVIKKIDIAGSVISTFSLSLSSLRHENIIQQLLDARNDPFFPKEFMEKHKMYQIGSYNTDLICVTAGTDQFTEGEILFVEEGYDIYNPQDNQIHPITKDFEQFLIAAGNLHQVREEIADDNLNHEEKKNEFIERLRVLGVDEKYHKAWLSVF